MGEFGGFESTFDILLLFFDYYYKKNDIFLSVVGFLDFSIIFHKKSIN